MYIFKRTGKGNLNIVVIRKVSIKSILNNRSKLQCVVVLLTLLLSPYIYAQNIPENYVRDIDRASSKYNMEMKQFLRGLNPHITQFNPQQKQQFCGIVNSYVNQFYAVTDVHRSALPLSYRKMTKQDVIEQVMQSKEMKILSRYNIQCEFDA